jgi:hypothetical protein
MFKALRHVQPASCLAVEEGIMHRQHGHDRSFELASNDVGCAKPHDLAVKEIFALDGRLWSCMDELE